MHQDPRQAPRKWSSSIIFMTWMPLSISFNPLDFSTTIFSECSSRRPEGGGQTQWLPHEWGLEKGITEAKFYPRRNSVQRRFRTHDLMTQRASTHRLHKTWWLGELEPRTRRREGGMNAKLSMLAPGIKRRVQVQLCKKNWRNWNHSPSPDPVKPHTTRIRAIPDKSGRWRSRASRRRQAEDVGVCHQASAMWWWQAEAGE
jgi:hypothetical protein